MLHANKNYELQYDDDSILIFDKINNILTIKVFSNEIKGINISAENSDILLNAKSFSLNTENEIKLKSNLPKNVPSIFLN